MLVSVATIAQDSSKLKPQIIIQARDCEIALVYSRSTKKLQDLDSVLLVKFRPPATAPTGTTSVTIDGVEARAWLEILTIMGSNTAIIRGGTFDRVKTVLLASGHSWLVTKVNRETADSDDQWTGFRKFGRDYGKKEDNSGF